MDVSMQTNDNINNTKDSNKESSGVTHSASFVHLHVHTHYSLLKSSCTISDLVDRCVEYSQPSLAITDYGNMFGALDLYFSARAKGIHPILGLEIYVCESLSDKTAFSGRDINKLSSVVLLAQNIEGYRHLCRLGTLAYSKGFYYVPRVDYEMLSKHSNSVLALTGGLYGCVPQSYLRKGPDTALKIARRLKDIYSDRLYLQLNRNGLTEWDSINNFLLEASRIMHVPLVAGGDVHYVSQKDHMVQDVLMCIGSNRTLRDPDRVKIKSDQFYFKDSNQMRKLFKDIPQVCDTTLEISNRCQVHFHLKKEGQPVYHLPRSPLGEEGGDVQLLKKLCEEGLQARLAEKESRPLGTSGKIKTSEQLKRQFTTQNNFYLMSEELKQNYRERLNQELKIIVDMGFTGYFLIVYDFVHWARKHGIPVGPGRGSGASSLAAYCLRITDLDPMPHHLLFERFLNPARISLPDFDIDFCPESRNRVIEYVTEKYGKDYVAQVITYGRLQARAAVRDVGRVLGMGYAEVDRVAKLIPDRLGVTLGEAVQENFQLKGLMEADPQINNLIELARRIEGLIRHVGIHAAGVIIADHPIVSYAPLYRGTEGENVIQCDLNHAKKIGLVKFDFLGLKTLTQINSAFRMIENRTSCKVRTQDISLEDKGIYQVMRTGDTKGVFQFEGEGITDLIVRAKPSCFEDIVAINALFRPGPMNMIPSYLDRKKGKVRVEYLFPELESILKETYGIIVYQEQVLLIAAKIAGYSYGEADILRRAMGEKKPAVMKKQKSRFISGAEENQYDLKKAERLFDLMAEFANYGFNKSHAAAYCVLAAQTAWLKYYYPVEFFASLLTTEVNNTDKMVQYIRDAARHKIEVLPPHINYSEVAFAAKKNKIYFSLAAIKGVGWLSVDHIISVRQQMKGGQFSSVKEFFESVDMKKMNKKTIEALVKAGALDGLGMNRKEILLNYESLLAQAEQRQTDAGSGQINLFASIDKSEESFCFRTEKDWPLSVKLENEKSVIGFYLSGHPMDEIDSFRSAYKCIPINKLQKKESKSLVCIWGIVNEFREIRTRKGLPMAFARLEDNTGSVELVIFSDMYLKLRTGIQLNRPVWVKGRISLGKTSSIKMIMQEIAYVQMDSLMQKSSQVQSDRLPDNNVDRKNSQQSVSEGSPTTLQSSNDNREDIYV